MRVGPPAAEMMCAFMAPSVTTWAYLEYRSVMTRMFVFLFRVCGRGPRRSTEMSSNGPVGGNNLSAVRCFLSVPPSLC